MIWKNLQRHVERFIEAARDLNGVEIMLQRQEKDYTEKFWVDAFASWGFRHNPKFSLPEIEDRLSKIADFLTNLNRDVDSLVPGEGEKKVPGLLKLRRDVRTWKRYAEILRDDVPKLKSIADSKGASDPSRVHEPNYRSLTLELEDEERSIFDDWKAGIRKLKGQIGDIESVLKSKIKEEAIAGNRNERAQLREEHKSVRKELNKGPKMDGDLNEIQDDFEGLESREKQLREKIKADDMSYLDHDIEKIRDAAESTKLLSGELIGFIRAGIVATNSYISDEMGQTHLKRNGISAQWIVGSYILIKNATLFGWKTKLEKSGKFDPVFALRRVKRNKPSAKWATKDYQIWSSHFVKRGEYTYALVLPAIRGRHVGLGEDKDIQIRLWDFGDSNSSKKEPTMPVKTKSPVKTKKVEVSSEVEDVDSFAPRGKKTKKAPAKTKKVKTKSKEKVKTKKTKKKAPAPEPKKLKRKKSRRARM